MPLLSCTFTILEKIMSSDIEFQIFSPPSRPNKIINLRLALSSNGMNNSGVGIEREGKIVLKKRQWTTAKDAVLSDMWSHGEGKWNAVQKNPPKSKTPFKH
ncbi:myb-like protein A [Gossypium australe]|uniref:Myb-like protein A n=1 Tax=Gossypium australe TaxID=47621 RepID=A0A5B6VTF4_9ROSI|nr:myb-like protein A [Gossypium australe]